MITRLASALAFTLALGLAGAAAADPVRPWGRHGGPVCEHEVRCRPVCCEPLAPDWPWTSTRLYGGATGDDDLAEDLAEDLDLDPVLVLEVDEPWPEPLVFVTAATVQADDPQRDARRQAALERLEQRAARDGTGR
jgi:hypothetical protein